MNKLVLIVDNDEVYVSELAKFFHTQTNMAAVLVESTYEADVILDSITPSLCIINLDTVEGERIELFASYRNSLRGVPICLLSVGPKKKLYDAACHLVENGFSNVSFCVLPLTVADYPYLLNWMKRDGDGKPALSGSIMDLDNYRCDMNDLEKKLDVGGVVFH
ncbi:hypothetical protein [Vibrio hangzhouensis]|uniref:Response regulatory domain-containing protein n=1 Tax=Vibrio hangzhouensis TaxID=462991 RepID=A0A1H5WXW9_9VIBR|nr:hypothetical protein [Vibrio hangzhouensis]SEG04341.1 hypothetical protein SAMN04488244_106120 [Vibrio hangzhouensis]